MKKYRLLFALLFALPLLFLSCRQGGAEAPSSDTTQFVDDLGRTVSVPSQPQRIVSLSPGVTEIIYALGADAHLVGRTDFCTYPPQCQRVQSVGGITNLNVEKILSLQPDLVIGGSMIPQAAIEQLQRLGIPVAIVGEKNRFSGLVDNILAIGSLTATYDQAQPLADAIISQLPHVDTLAQRPSVYYVVGFGAGGNYTAGGNTFISDIITLAGGRNIASDVDGWSYSLEALMANDPDFVVIRREDSAQFVSTKPYSTLRAVRQGHVVAIESGIIDVQVPRNIDAITQLATRFGAWQQR